MSPVIPPLFPEISVSLRRTDTSFKRLSLIDMFPQTYHMEVVALLSLKGFKGLRDQGVEGRMITSGPDVSGVNTRTLDLLNP